MKCKTCNVKHQNQPSVQLHTHKNKENRTTLHMANSFQLCKKGNKVKLYIQKHKVKVCFAHSFPLHTFLCELLLSAEFLLNDARQSKLGFKPVRPAMSNTKNLINSNEINM